MNKQTIENIDVKGKKVLVRCDFNVPLDENKNITDKNRIVGALPTIKYLIDNNAKVILCSHLGRPKGEFNPKYSLAPVAKELSAQLGKTVVMATDVIGDDAKAKVEALNDGECMLLENVRFHKEEEKNDAEFSKQLASLAEIFVNDAFGTAHRAHASTAGVAKFLPAVSGYLIQKELDIMGKALDDPKRPFVAILGGAKVSDKIGVIENLIEKVDCLIIGGGMAYTFDKALGREIGTSLCEDDKIELAKSLIEKAKGKGVELLLPTDTVVADRFDKEADSKVVDVHNIPSDWMGLDIGPNSIKLFSDRIANAKTVIWNGPMGVFEFPKFANGTKELARAVANADATTIIGGGDSAAAVEQLGFADKMTHISTGGGASLEFLEGLVLPGIDCLLDAESKKKYAIGNWKMNYTPSQAKEFVTNLVGKVSDAKCEVIVCAPFVSLSTVVDAVKGTNIAVGAQNMYFEDKGAFTGEISAEMLVDLGVKYVIIGHSERRQFFAETCETVNKKVAQALKFGLTPIVCVGESLEQRQDGLTAELLRLQTKRAFKGIADVEKCIIAYEPIWAIGTGVTATNEQADEACGVIRECLAELYNEKTADNCVILYGGSVTAANANALFACKNIDGGLVGGASLKADDFAVIAE